MILAWLCSKQTKEGKIPGNVYRIVAFNLYIYFHDPSFRCIFPLKMQFGPISKFQLRILSCIKSCTTAVKMTKTAKAMGGAELICRALYESTNWNKPNAFYRIKKALFVVDIFNFQVAEI